MPCSNRKARLLLREKKAKVVHYRPFTIQLLYATGEATQKVEIGVDSGAKYVGMAIVSRNRILVKGNMELRQDVKELLTVRRTLRRSRRNRKTRYRRCKFRYSTKRVYDPKKNKFIKRNISFTTGRKEGWLPPSIQSRVDNQIQWIKRFASLVPHPKMTVEVGKFDVQKMMNPAIQGEQYQQGDAYGFWETRYYVFARDHYTCQFCHKPGGILQTHHIIRRRDGGSDRADNLTTVHLDCHEKFHQGKIRHTFSKPKVYRETAFMNILRHHIYRQLGCSITYGNITTAHRKELGWAKSHVNDAIALLGVRSYREYDASGLFLLKQFRKKKRSLHESIPRKGRKEPNRTQKRNEKNVKWRNGFYLNDRVQVLGQIGYISGFCEGGMYVKSIDGDYITLPHKTYKQVSFKYVQFLSHTNTWQWEHPENRSLSSPFENGRIPAYHLKTRA